MWYSESCDFNIKESQGLANLINSPIKFATCIGFCNSLIINVLYVYYHKIKFMKSTIFYYEIKKTKLLLHNTNKLCWVVSFNSLPKTIFKKLSKMVNKFVYFKLSILLKMEFCVVHYFVCFGKKKVYII